MIDARNMAGNYWRVREVPVSLSIRVYTASSLSPHEEQWWIRTKGREALQGEGEESSTAVVQMDMQHAYIHVEYGKE
jgi:hypothetical protein